MKFHKIVFTYSVIILALISSGCSSSSRTDSPSGGGAGSERSLENPTGTQDASDEEQPPVEMSGPEPLQIRPIVLVLGPGRARTLSYVGILRALHDEKIPIRAIVGTEMGALIAALYATSKSINEFEWKAQKLKEIHYQDVDSSISRFFGRESREEALKAFLQENFASLSFGGARVPLYLGTATEDSGYTYIQSGNLSGILLRSILSPIQSQSFSLDPLRSSFSSEAPIVVVNAYEKVNSSEQDEHELGYQSRLEDLSSEISSYLEKADFVIHPYLNQAGYLDFSKKSMFIFRGKNALSSNLFELRQLVGLEKKESHL